VQDVTSDALIEVSRSLGLTQQPGLPSPVQFASKILDQVFVVNESARRGRTLIGSEGIFNVQFTNVHVGAGLIQTTVDPYRPDTDANPPYLGIIPTGFDFWLIGATDATLSGFAQYDNSVLLEVMPSASRAFIGAGEATIPIAAWTTPEIQFVGLNTFHPSIGSGLLYTPLGIRIPRGTVLRYASISTGIATYVCQCIAGLFPSALGQDVQQ